MSRQIRFTALLLAVCLFLNSVAFPAAAEGDPEPTLETTEVTTVPAEETTTPAEESAASAKEAADPAEESTDPTGEPTYPMPQFKPEGNTLQITSARELLMLSYVAPEEYCNLNLTFCPSDEENVGFDLLTKSDSLEFQGLGSEEYPFRGEILFADETGPIALDRPLFNVLSDDAKITGLSLESHVQGAGESGLLAKTVTHGQGGNTWTVTLTQPDATAECNLIPLISNLENGTDVSVNLTDLSGLSVLGSGYLCAVMGENAQLTLSGIDTIPAVTGSGDAVGGLVGLMKSSASLTVMGESITVTGVNGNWNAGGIVGSATDPLLSLPPVVGCDGAVVSGDNVGGVIGRLTYTPGDHALSLSLSNLTLEGSDNAGGLIGVLLRDEGTLALDAQADGITLAEDAINGGSLFGTYYTSNPENSLILNDEPIADEAELEALVGLVDYPGKLEIIITVEEAQEIIDSILEAELRPGEMSPLWWAVVSGKLTAEELAAELNAYYSGAEETEPSEETEPTEASEESETTESTEATETQEADNLPQEPPQGEADDSLETASFSLRADASPVFFAEESTEPASTFLESLVSSYAAEDTPDWPEGKSFEITTVEDLVLLSYVEQSTYEKKGVKVIKGSVFDLTQSYNVTSGETTYPGLSFQGLGNETHPFSGSFTLDPSCSNLVIKLNQPLFSALADTATLSTLTLRSSMSTQPTAPNAALLAEKVYHTDATQSEGEPSAQSTSNNWEIRLQGIKGFSLPLIGIIVERSIVSVNVSSFSVGTVGKNDQGNDEDLSFTTEGCSASDLTVLGGGFLCSTIKSGASLSVTGISEIPVVVNASGNAGGLVGTMESDAILNDIDAASLTLSSITATNGNAGGLVGKLDAHATINMPNASLTLANITSTGSGVNGNAGGLIGYGENPDLRNLPSISNPTSITISGRSAGGLVGWLQNSGNNSFELNKSISNVTLSGTDSSGGLIGELHNDKAAADAAAISYTLSAPAAVTTDEEGAQITSPRISNISLEGGSAGGLIGKYYTNDLANTLKIDNISVISSSSATNYGGVIGNVGSGVSAYVEFSNVTSTASEPSSTYFGGLIGLLSDAGHMVKVGENITINATSTGNGGSGIGGLIGYMPQGVLYITGSSSPVLSYNSITNKNAATRGWILGNRGNTLVFTDISNWNAEKDSKSETNDTGVWGQMLRVDNMSDLFVTGNTETGDKKTISQHISENHSVTIGAVSQETITDSQGNNVNALTVSNVVDFAKVALRLQLDETSCLKFAGNPSGDLNASGTITISLKSSVNLNDTGLTGLTRDVGKDNAFSPVFNIQIIGTLTNEGNAPVITLPSLKVYTIDGSHNRQGLIAKAGILTVTNLTLATTSGTDGVQTHLINNGNTYTGLLAAEASGNVTLNNVTSSAKLKITGSAGDNNSRAAGLIAQVTSDGTLLTFTNCTWNGLIQDEATGNDRCAGFLAYSEKSNTSYKITSCTVGGTINKAQTVDYVSVGGLISALSKGTGIQLNIDGLEVKNAHITAAGSKSSDKCGGLLGYEWFNVTATLSNITVTGSSLDAGNSNFGGLVYKGSGYWQIGREQENGTVQSGVTFTGTNTFTGLSSDSAPSGLLVCHGDKVDIDITQSALYLEVLPGAYIINSTFQGLDSFTSFDELMGTTISADGLNNGIVSIATENHAPIDPSNNCNTYKQQISGNQWNNKNTRYYYNLDLFRKNLGLGNDGKIVGDTGSINSAEKMVLFSAWSHCHSGLQQYFLNTSPSVIKNPESGVLDLTGYSYYPVPFRGTSIENATISFDYEGLETAESSGISLSGGGTASNKKPSNQDRQHYGMHTGIFTDVGSASANASLNIDGLTLQGTVGGSAIINGTARGKESNAMTELLISNVKLDGIRTVTAAEGELLPLLINSIESFTSLELTDVTTLNSYSDLGGSHAATSLIGNVGEKNGDNQVGQYIQLDFSQIALDGRIDADGSNTPVHNTTHSIFRDALFLKDFQYADTNSWGIYNFTKPGENEAKKYTLGAELSNGETDENVRNGGEQFYFYGSTTDYVYLDVNPNAAADGSQATTFFKNTYRRYVGNMETGKQHEMDINLLSPNIIDGCGTYSHPYVITNGKQLLAVANVLKGVNPKKGWTITLNSTVLDSGFSSQASHAVSNDKEYSWDEKWIDENGVALNSDTNAGKTRVINYLRNAYYQLKGNEDNSHIITLSSRSGWGGLGSNTYPFQGVIVGETDSEGNSNVTVHINAPSATQFGGLIAFSTGSVVKNVKIQYDQAPSIACSSAPSTIDAPFFGGVVGWCIGGDTIIDNVTVTYASTETSNVSPAITGDMAYLVPVGGYVGLVGGTEGLNDTTNGLGGGVVFRGTNTTSLSVSVNGASVTTSGENGNYFYFNPYVGRVLDGYAITEGSEFINTNKNYTIPSVASSGLSIDDSGNIEVSDGAGLWLLSAIINSGAASMPDYGKARFCNYDTVGGTFPEGGIADEASGASPYLIRKFSLDNGFKTITASAVSIELTGNCDMTNYGNGFRGIGTSYSANNNYNRLIKVKQLDGGSKTVTLAQNRKEYLDEGSSWTSIGTGLFVRLYQDSSSNPTTIKNLTLKGSAGITYYNGTSSDTNNSNGVLYKSIKDTNLYGNRLNQVGVGMLASSVANVGTTNLTIENVTLDNVNVNFGDFCSVFAGGMIGVIWGGGGGSSSDYLTVTLKDCAYTNPTVRGFVDAGGFIGRVKAENNSKFAKIVITYSEAKQLEGGNIATTSTTYERGSNFSTVGGLIGCTYYYDLVVQPYESSNAMLTISNLNVNSSYTGNTGDKVFGGGLVGLCYTPKTNCTIQNVKLEGNNSISGADNNNRRQLIGGLIGTLTHTFSWHSAGSASVTVSDIHIAESGSLKLQYTQQAGALFGILNISGKIQMNDIFIGSESNSPSVIIGNIRSDDSSNIGGLIGGGNALKDVTLERIQMNNVYLLHNNNSNKDTRGAALLLGFLESSDGATDAKVNIRDVTLKNSNVVRSDKKNRAGFVYGHLNKGNSNPPAITGSNILIENCNLGYATLDNSINLDNFTLPTLSIDGTAAGIIGGNCKDSLTSVQLVGVRVKGCTAPAQNFGTTNPKAGSYVIRADYSKAATKASDITSVPSSNISIKETAESSAKVLTSDGACFTGKNSTTSIAEQIMCDYYSGVTCNSYFSIASAITDFASKSEEIVTISEKLDTFHVAGELSDDDKTAIPNFPVLVINSNAGSDANSIVQSFITVLTNDTVAPRSISAATYQWSAGSENQPGGFTRAKTASLTVSSDGTVSITPGGYDNQRSQFTLLDVTYADPTGGANPYHLYIPVIVKKIMVFKFWASTQNGSSYSAGDYANLSQTTLASNKELVTSLLTFQYQWDASQWQTAVDTGTYLLWNFDKEFTLHPLNQYLPPLPEGTRMTLVDRNNQNKTYYARTTSSSIGDPITIKFSEFSDGNKWSWNSSTFLCDLLELESESAENGKFARCTDNDQGKATLRIKTGDDFQYYRPAETGDTSTFNITVGLGDRKYAEETFFLTFQTNEPTSNGPYACLIQCGTKLVVPSNLPEGKSGLPTILRPKTEGNSNSCASANENCVIVNDFFTQTVTVSTGDSNQEMSSSEGSSNDTITGTLTTTIKFPEEDEYPYTLFTGHIGTQKLKQQFCLYLKDQDGNPVDFVDGTELIIDGKTYETVEGSSAALWLPVQNVTEWGEESGHPATVSVDFTLHYPTPESLVEQFPDKGDDGSVGIQVYATSCLSMNENALQRSNQRETAYDTQKKFYRTDVNLATMFYNAYDVDYPTQESGLSSLGINGWSTDNPPINSVALYNVGALNKDGFHPTYLRCTVELLQKGEGDEYKQVVVPTDTAAPLMAYLSSIEVIPKVYVDNKYQQLSSETNSFIFELPSGVSWHENVQIDVNFAVRHGIDFESSSHTYANYRVRLSAELLDSSKTRLPGTFAHDYIIYTNAKIRKELIS